MEEVARQVHRLDKAVVLRGGQLAMDSIIAQVKNLETIKGVKEPGWERTREGIVGEIDVSEEGEVHDRGRDDAGEAKRR